jgi:hypothetical protein
MTADGSPSAGFDFSDPKYEPSIAIKKRAKKPSNEFFVILFI